MMSHVEIRILSFCGVIAETNRQLGGIATISCSVNEGLIFYEGRRMFSNYAIAKLDDVVSFFHCLPDHYSYHCSNINQLIYEVEKMSVK